MTIESTQVVYLVAPAGTGKVRLPHHIVCILILYDKIHIFNSFHCHTENTYTKYKQSFSGDYLQVVHGYKHIDGDGPLKSMIMPKYSDMTKITLHQVGNLRLTLGRLQIKHSMQPKIMTESFLPMPHTIKNPVTLLLIHL